jgi:hypothetical protein
MVLGDDSTESENYRAKKRFQLSDIPQELKDDFGRVFNIGLAIISPSIYAVKTGFASNSLGNWYTKTKESLVRGALTAGACFILSFIGDGCMTKNADRISSSRQIDTEFGKIEYRDIKKLTIKDSSLSRRILFPIVRFFNPHTYRREDAYTEFSGFVEKEGLEFQIQGKFPEIRGSSEVKFQDFKDYVSSISVDKDSTLRYLSK